MDNKRKKFMLARFESLKMTFFFKRIAFVFITPLRESYLWYEHNAKGRSCAKKNADACYYKRRLELLFVYKSYNWSSNNANDNDVVNGHT